MNQGFIRLRERWRLGRGQFDFYFQKTLQDDLFSIRLGGTAASVICLFPVCVLYTSLTHCKGKREESPLDFQAAYLIQLRAPGRRKMCKLV